MQITVNESSTRYGCALGFLAITLVLVLAGHSHTFASAVYARPGDILMDLTLFPTTGVITAGEPLIVKVGLTNASYGDVHLLLGDGKVSTMSVEIRNDKSQMVASTPPCESGRDGTKRLLTLHPAENQTLYRIVSALYQFRTPGNYSVRVALIDAASKDLPVLAEAMVTIQVQPFDASRLEARCEDLFAPIRRGNWPKTELPDAVRAKALYSVRNDVILPYLEWLVNKGSEHAAFAVRRMETDRAKTLFESLLTRSGKAGVAASRALTMRIDDPARLVIDMSAP